MTINQQQNLRGELLRDEPMARHTSWRTGGSAKIYYRPADIEDLSLFLSRQDKNENIIFIGLGSNLLVRDGGIDGTVICTSGLLNEMKLLPDMCLYVESGVASPKVARLAAKNGLTGTEFLCGIPGTFGGALAMNAGAMGGETWDVVKSVNTIDRQGVIHTRQADDFNIAYRSVKAKPGSGFKTGTNEWFVAATLQLKPGNREESEQKIKSHLARRGATQPTQQPNAGSVFRNPKGDYAARLIEAAGLKGFCIGGACVSEKHANFIINKGTATALDIEELIEYVHKKVNDESGINMIREVRITGKNA